MLRLESHIWEGGGANAQNSKSVQASKKCTRTHLWHQAVAGPRRARDPESKRDGKMEREREGERVREGEEEE